MFSREENELLTRVGPGTAIGNLMRRYWLPALLSEEIPLPDCPPVGFAVGALPDGIEAQFVIPFDTVHAVFEALNAQGKKAGEK